MWPAGVIVLVAAVAGVALITASGDGDGQPAAGGDDRPTGADASPATTGQRWRAYTDPDAARAVAPAPDGGAWVGTRSAGVVRWAGDGGDVQRHHLPDDGGRPQGVHALAVAGDGTVWAATHRLVRPTGPADFDGTGVAAFDGQQWTSHDFDDAVAEPWVSSLAAHDGAVWAVVESNAGTGAQGGVARFADGRWTTWTGDDGLPGTPRELAITDDGAVWVANPGWVARFDGGQWTNWASDGALPGPGVSSLSVGDGGVWVATLGGVARFADGQWTSWTTGADLPGDWVAALATGGDGRVWAVTASGPADPEADLADARLVGFDGQGWSADADVPFERMRSLTVDGDGTLWAATGAQHPGQRDAPGLARFDGQAWQRVTRDDGLPHDRVRALTVADDGTVWAGTAGGAARFADGTWTRYVTGAGPPGEAVTAVAVADGGAVWVGGRAGVARLADGRWTSWDAGDGLPSDRVHALAVANDRTVWAGTADGVSRLDDGQWVSPPGDALGSRPVRSLAVADGGAVWAVAGDAPQTMSFPPQGRLDNRVARFADGEWTVWPSDEVAGSALAVDVSVDADGTPWVAATSPLVGPGEDAPPAAVARFDGQRWRHETTDGAVPGEHVAGVAAVDGTVWVATETGPARFDGRRWRQPLAGGAGGAPEDAEPAGTSQVTASGAATAWFDRPEGLLRVDASGQPVAEVIGGGPFREVRALAAGHDAVWIGAAHGLVRLAR